MSRCGKVRPSTSLYGRLTFNRPSRSAHRQTARPLSELRQHARLIRKGTRRKKLEIARLSGSARCAGAAIFRLSFALRTLADQASIANDLPAPGPGSVNECVGFGGTAGAFGCSTDSLNQNQDRARNPRHEPAWFCIRWPSRRGGRESDRRVIAVAPPSTARRAESAHGRAAKAALSLPSV